MLKMAVYSEALDSGVSLDASQIYLSLRTRYATLGEGMETVKTMAHHASPSKVFSHVRKYAE